MLVRALAFCENSFAFSLGSFLLPLPSGNSLMTPYEFGRFIKLATQPASFAPSSLPAKKPGPSAYEKNWQPKQRSYGKTQLIPPMTPDMAAPGRAGGTYRRAIGKPDVTRTFGRPKQTEQLRRSPDGEMEIYNPQAEYDARPNNT